MEKTAIALREICGKLIGTELYERRRRVGCFRLGVAVVVVFLAILMSAVATVEKVGWR